MPPGGPRCPACEALLELEALPERTYSSCPRCAFALSTLATGAGPLDECERCGGLFVVHETLRALIDARRPPPVTGADPPGATAHFASSHPPPPHALLPITYLPCPSCTRPMNRKLFGRGSAVVVDTCKMHGTWFDQGKLTMALTFVALGGLEPPWSATGAVGVTGTPGTPAPVRAARK